MSGTLALTHARGERIGTSLSPLVLSLSVIIVSLPAPALTAACADGARRDRHRPNRAPMVSTVAPLLCAYHAPPVTRIWNTVERRFELATPPGGHGLSRGPIELQMPMANIRRRTPDFGTRGLTHRHLLPLDPRDRNPGTNCYESSMRFELPGNPRAQVSWHSCAVYQ